MKTLEWIFEEMDIFNKHFPFPVSFYLGLPLLSVNCGPVVFSHLVSTH